MGMRDEHLAEADKSPHDGGVHLDGGSLFKTLESMATPCAVKA